MCVTILSCFFQYDQNYVGVPPPKEITLTNLNDNINRDFLANMCKGFGTMEEVKVYYHPKTKKHIGIGKVNAYSFHYILSIILFSMFSLSNMFLFIIWEEFCIYNSRYTSTKTQTRF